MLWLSLMSMKQDKCVQFVNKQCLHSQNLIHFQIDMCTASILGYSWFSYTSLLVHSAAVNIYFRHHLYCYSFSKGPSLKPKADFRVQYNYFSSIAKLFIWCMEGKTTLVFLVLVWKCAQYWHIKSHFVSVNFISHSRCRWFGHYVKLPIKLHWETTAVAQWSVAKFYYCSVFWIAFSVRKSNCITLYLADNFIVFIWYNEWVPC